MNPRRKRRVKRNAKGRFVKRATKTVRRRKRRSAAIATPAVRRRRRSVRRVRASNPRRSRRTVRVSRRRRARRYSNPLNFRGLTGHLMPAVIGAAGALASDVAVGYVAKYLPTMLTTGVARYAVRAAGVFGFSMLAGKVIGKSKSDTILAAGLTILAYQAMKELLAQYVPSITPMGDFEEVTLGYIDPAMTVGALDYNGAGAYQNFDDGTGANMTQQINGYQMEGMGGYMT